MFKKDSNMDPKFILNAVYYIFMNRGPVSLYVCMLI